jgi:hypothetical protein
LLCNHNTFFFGIFFFSIYFDTIFLCFFVCFLTPPWSRCLPKNWVTPPQVQAIFQFPTQS